MTAPTIAAGQCWVVLEREGVPDEWLHRVSSLAVLRLVPHEIARLLDCASSGEALSAQDRELADALLAGRSVPAIARSLGISPRSVQRRIARLRDRLSVTSTEQLVAALVRMGL